MRDNSQRLQMFEVENEIEMDEIFIGKLFITYIKI